MKVSQNQAADCGNRGDAGPCVRGLILALAGFNDRRDAYNDTSAPFKCTQVLRDQMHTDGQPGGP